MSSKTLRNLEDFLKNPTLESLEKLDRYVSAIIYAWSTYCIDKKKGDIANARKIR